MSDEERFDLFSRLSNFSSIWKAVADGDCIISDDGKTGWEWRSMHIGKGKYVWGAREVEVRLGHVTVVKGRDRKDLQYLCPNLRETKSEYGMENSFNKCMKAIEVVTAKWRQSQNG